MSLLAAWLAVACAQSPALETARPEPFDARTLARILQHSPLPPLPPDPTNRVADDPRAARLGQALFFDTRLSASGTVSCATCHDPARAFTDGRDVSMGLSAGTRNAPTLLNVAYQRWFFWDGRADSAWSQALHPLESAVEMGSDRRAILRLLASDANLRPQYEHVFGPLPDARFLALDAPATQDPRPAEDRARVDRAFADLGKAIAAYERRLVAANSPFDRYVSALRTGDAQAAAAYPEAARRGLATFVGKGDCRACHAGPLFSDGEFHDVGVPARRGADGAFLARDPGRRVGLERLVTDPFRASSAFSDEPAGERALELDALARGPEFHARMRTPSLRNVALTAPYMHAGQIATLREVIEFYSTRAGAAPAGHHAETILRPLELSRGEIDDLIAFLGTLTDDALAPDLLRAPSRPRDEPQAR